MPLPALDAPEVTDSQGADVVAVQLQPDDVVTLNDVEPPLAPNDMLDGLTKYEHVCPCWLTETV